MIAEPWLSIVSWSAAVLLVAFLIFWTPKLPIFRRHKGRETKHPDDKCNLIPLGRDEYKYCDGDHALVLQIDMLMGKPDRLLYSSTIKRWLPPHENEAIDSTQRREIAERIGRCLEKAGYTVEID
jgi:immunity protein 74 of polymorphic toxin system